MNKSCCTGTFDPCPNGIPDAGCVAYTGANLPCLGVTTNMRLDDILALIEVQACTSGDNLTFNNAITRTDNLVQWGGLLVKNTIFDFNGFDVTVEGVAEDDSSPFLLAIDGSNNIKVVAASTFITDVPATTLPSTIGQNGISATFDFDSRTYTVELGANPLIHPTTLDLAGFILNMPDDNMQFYGINLTSVTTFASIDFQHLLHVDLSGANDNAGQTTHAGYFTNTHTGTTSRNVGLFSEATGGTENFAAYFNQQIRLCDPSIEGQRLDIFGGNPSAIAGFGSNLVIQMNTVQHVQFQTDTVRWNGQGADLLYEFRVCGDVDDNLLNIQAGGGLASHNMIGINQSPLYTLDVRTKYTSRFANSVFYIGNWVGKRHFPNTDPIPVPAIGFGVGHRFQLENSSETLFEAARLDFVSTAITAASESVDCVINLVNAGAVGAKFTVKSTGAIQTVQPSGSGAGQWLLGKLITAAVTASTTRYLEVMVDGVVYKLIVST